jgi:cytochrome c biogenesis protein CcmG, thiol:disulfide interchange protein DsbE
VQGAKAASLKVVEFYFMSRLITVVAIVAVLGGLFYFGLTRTNTGRSDIPTARLNEPAKNFALPVFERYQTQYGPTFELADHIGKQPIVINFWASWCGPCRTEMPMLEAAWREYQGQVLFLGIQYNDSKDAGNTFLDEFTVSYPNVRDDVNGKSVVGIDYALFGLPETFFIRTDGTIAHKQSGEVTAALLEEKIGELLQ